MTSHSKRARTGETVREEAVNALLGEALKRRGIDARAERRRRGNAPDIRFELRSGDLVLIECKWESGRTSLQSQLDDRVTAIPDAAGRVGVLYPDRLKNEADVSAALESADDLKWYVHSSREDIRADPTVRSGSLAALADHLRLLPHEIDDQVIKAVAAVGYALDQSAQELSRHARTARRVAEIIATTDKERDRAAAWRIGCLVLFNALSFQDRLAVVNDQVQTVGEIMTDLRGGGGYKTAS